VRTLGCTVGGEDETALFELLLDPLEPNPSLKLFTPEVRRENPFITVSSFSSLGADSFTVVTGTEEYVENGIKALPPFLLLLQD
jgi:hypothetical protein